MMNVQTNLTYTLEPNKLLSDNRRYRLEELERMTLLQLRDVCERERIIHPDLYELDRERIIRLLMQFRGSRTPRLISKNSDAGVTRLEKALAGVKQRNIPHSISLPSRIVVWEGLATNSFDGYAIPWDKDLDGVNAVVLDYESNICALMRFESISGSKGLYLTRCEALSCREAAVKDYKLIAFPHALSDLIFDLYEGVEGVVLPPEIQIYSMPLLDFVVRQPLESELPLSIDFGTTNTAAGIFADHLFCDRLKDSLPAGQIIPESINCVHWLSLSGEEQPVLPTIIGVDKIENGVPVYNIGHEAERMVLEGSVSANFSIWYDLKRWISDYDREEELSDYLGNRLLLKRKEIIRAFLLYVIESARQRFKCNFPKLFLSYPVKQKARFVSLYRDILPEYNILEDETIDEGVAVLYNTIRSYIGNEYYENGARYKALIIDCGGGTTDLSSCDFSITNERIAYRIDVETAYENGDTDFGGNNLTYRILQLIKIEAARIISGCGPTLEEVTSDLEQDFYRIVDESGVAGLYQAFEQAYDTAEQVVPTRFKDYEQHGRDEYYLVRNNYYYLFTLAEKVKKAFFSDSRILQVMIASNPVSEVLRTTVIQAPRWKLAAMTRKGLELQQDFPTISLGASLVRTVLHPDIYDLVRRFLAPLKLQEYSVINLTGQSCKIPLFRDAIKEFLPGRMIRSGNIRKTEDYRLKLSCLEGAVRYISDRQLGLTRVTIQSKDAALPWQLYTWTHGGEKVVLVQRLDRENNHGSVSRPLESSRLQIYLEDTRGREKHVYTLFCPPDEFVPTTYEEIAKLYEKQIPQTEVDVIENGEIRYFVWADTQLWGFYVVPVARWNDSLQMGKQQIFPFENENWTANFFNGEN